MGFSLYSHSLLEFKTFFKLFNNITNRTAFICNTYGIEIKSSNARFQIDSIFDEINFKKFNCSKEYILSISIKLINQICNKYEDTASIRILYNENTNILIIINNHSHLIPCQLINNTAYIKSIKDVDSLDYHVEFEISSKYIYALIKQISKQTSNTITIRSDPITQHIYINDVSISKKKTS